MTKREWEWLRNIWLQKGNKFRLNDFRRKGMSSNGNGNDSEREWLQTKNPYNPLEKLLRTFRRKHHEIPTQTFLQDFQDEAPLVLCKNPSNLHSGTPSGKIFFSHSDENVFKLSPKMFLQSFRPKFLQIFRMKLLQIIQVKFSWSIRMKILQTQRKSFQASGQNFFHPLGWNSTKNFAKIPSSL